MNLDERISESLNLGLARVDAYPPGLAEVERRGRGVRRRRVALGAAVAALVVGAAVVTPRLADGGAVEPARPAGTWRELPPAPLSGRWQALAAWTGEEVLVVGGGISTPCPPAASCTEPDVIARDGAAYDPDTGTWRRITTAPIPMESWFRTSMVGDTMVVLAAFERGADRWFAYDTSDDEWRELPPPERNVNDWGAIPSLHGRVYALAKSGDVLVLDLATETWSELPRSPLRPELDAESVIPTTEGVFVSGVDATVEEDGDEPSFIEVERWDGREWTRYPVTDQEWRFEHYTGSKLVAADIQAAPGLADDPPHGGRLDPATGEWAALPNTPDVDAPRPDSWSVYAADGPLVAGWEYVYDDRDGSWSLLGKPDSPVDTGQAAVWADGRLVVFGGVDSEVGYEDEAGLSNEAWVWTP